MELGQVARKRNTWWMTCAIFTESHLERFLIQIIRRDINVVDDLRNFYRITPGEVSDSDNTEGY
jgi:hypothetical protein